MTHILHYGSVHYSKCTNKCAFIFNADKDSKSGSPQVIRYVSSARFNNDRFQGWGLNSEQVK